jgi:hypothetical protein
LEKLAASLEPPALREGKKRLKKRERGPADVYIHIYMYRYRYRHRYSHLFIYRGWHAGDTLWMEAKYEVVRGIW